MLLATVPWSSLSALLIFALDIAAGVALTLPDDQLFSLTLRPACPRFARATPPRARVPLAPPRLSITVSCVARGSTRTPLSAGDKGESFYVVERGRFDIVVGGKKVADFGEGTPNMSFGELALLYNSPRAASVIASTAAKLWALDRVTFRGIVAKASHAQHSRLKTTLRRGILETLTDEQIAKVAAYVCRLIGFE